RINHERILVSSTMSINQSFGAMSKQQISEGQGKLSFESDTPTNGNKKRVDKDEKIAKKKAGLLADLAGGHLDKIHTRVAYILNAHPDARNSDIALAIHYWQQFERDHLAG